MPAVVAVYLITWVLAGFAARPLARRLGNPGSWPVVLLLGALGVLVLAAASWPWPSQGHGPR
jgi:hypothetical protein